MKKILVPIDFSEEARYGFNFAVQIAKRTASTVYLLNCVPSPSPSFSSIGDTIQHGEEVQEENRYTIELIRANALKLDQWIDQSPVRGVEIMPMVKINELQEAISEIIDEEQIDLVIMGTSGETAFSELLSGNNTEKVIRIFKCPVISVKKDYSNYEIKNIVLATDLRKETIERIAFIKKFASYYNASIHVLHVASTGVDELEVRQKLDDFVVKYNLFNYTLNVIFNNNEVKGIKQFAKDMNADMIVVAAHPRSSLANFLFNASISENVVEEASKPVLTIHVDE